MKVTSGCFIIFGGSNYGTLWSILSRCSRERKRNPPIQFIKKADVEEFETDADDSSRIPPENGLLEHRVRFNITNGESQLRLSAGRNQTLQNVNGSAEFQQDISDEGNTADENDYDLNTAVFPFKTHKTRTAQIFSIVLSENSRTKTIVTEQHIISCSVHQFTNDTRSKADFSRTCPSCQRSVAIERYRLPWELTSAQRICIDCYKLYSRSKMRCCKCNKIYAKAVMQGRIRKEKKKAYIDNDDKAVEGYPCDVCDGVIKQFGEQQSKANSEDQHRQDPVIFVDQKNLAPGEKCLG